MKKFLGDDMTNIKVVIGSNFGDEGKGLMTDYFCHQATSKGESCVVAMSNGGAQRGHTVVDPSGIRHVFKHFGSGTFSKANTYCTSDFILNPMEFRREYEELATINYTPQLYWNPNCRWSTPYDMIINQIVEETREHKKHGSCGMGIWETVVRYQQYPFTPSLFKFWSDGYEKQVTLLKNIRDAYVPERLKSYGIKSVPNAWKNIVYSDNLIDNFIYDVDFMMKHTISCGDNCLAYHQNVIFENGQGLLLDQNQTVFGDNTTPSNTGILNPLNTMNATFDKANVEICYVTRTYLTRHGAGRFDEECDKSLINANMIDMTNQTNQFQGSLRYGELNVEDLIYRTLSDLRYLSNSRFNWKASFGVTHTNEKQFDYEELYRGPIKNVYLSNAEDRNSVMLLK